MIKNYGQCNWAVINLLV